VSHRARPHRTRRELLRVLPGAPGVGDTARLASLLELEQVAVALYRMAHRSGQLSPGAAELVRELAFQEGEHAQELSSAVGRPAHTVRLPSQSAPSIEQLEATLARVKVGVDLRALDGEREWFTLLEQLEGALEGAYYEALGELVSPAAATLAARILASEAQHQTLLFRQRHPGEVSLAVSRGLVFGNAPPPQ
jgi:hypothetical protein